MAFLILSRAKKGPKKFLGYTGPRTSTASPDHTLTLLCGARHKPAHPPSKGRHVHPYSWIATVDKRPFTLISDRYYTHALPGIFATYNRKAPRPVKAKGQSR